MLVVAALCIAGVIYKGAEVTQVNVNDGGIWVTNKSKQLVGHLDYEARILDGALRTEATNFDVGQAGETVTVSDLGSLTVAPVNVTQVALGNGSNPLLVRTTPGLDADKHGAVPKPNEARLVVLQKGCPIGRLAGQWRGRGVFGCIEGHGFEPAQHGLDATLHGLLRRGQVWGTVVSSSV